MKKILISFIIIVSFSCVWFLGCENDVPDSLYNPDADYAPNPVITSVEPDTGVYAGISEVVITGENFSTEMEDNDVYFGSKKGEVLSASPTQLVVLAPAITGDSLRVNVHVKGALLFADYFPVKLREAIHNYGDLQDFEDAYGMACDSDENLYVALTDRNVYKIEPGKDANGNLGVRTELGQSRIVRVTAMKMGPDNTLYLARNSTSMYTMALDGSNASRWTSAPGRVYDLDFSPTGMIYAGGKNDSLFQILPDGTGKGITAYPDIYIKAVRVYNGYVYVGGELNSTEERFIWRNEIISDNELGEREVVFNWTENYGEFSEILSLTFAADGDMYVGSNGDEAIVVIHPDGSHEPLYPSLIEPDTYAMVWGTGKYLYVNRRNETDPEKKKIIRINMRKQGAPYYGRQL